MVRTHLTLFFLSLLVISTFNAVNAEEIYTWRDESGYLHFSDSPPREVTAKTIDDFLSIDSPKRSQLQNALEKSQPDIMAPEGGGMFWKIETGRDEPSYLLGTIHSEDERVLQLSETVIRALERSKAFIMEMKMTPGAVLKMGTAMVFKNDQELKTLLGDADYQKVSEIMSGYGIPEPILRKMKPWAVTATLSVPKPKTGKFMDIVLSNQAKSLGIGVHGLESVDEQLAVFDDMPISDQISLLKLTLEYLPEMPQMYETLIQTYMADDLMAIAELSNNYIRHGHQGLAKRFIARLNDQRNERMVRRMLSYIESGNAFIAVGAMHLTGTKGIIKQLRERGYQVVALKR